MYEEVKEQHVIANSSVRSYFYETFNNALIHQKKYLNPETTIYIVNLLTNFSKTEKAFSVSQQEFGLKPLAFIYADAVHSETKKEKFLHYKYLGDITLFISGIYYLSLNRSLVDVDYYIGMGENAYQTLGSADHFYENSAFQLIFSELSQQFLAVVELLNEISYEMQHHNQEDVLRLYEIWLKTNNQFCAEKLRALGIEPNPSIQQSHH